MLRPVAHPPERYFELMCRITVVAGYVPFMTSGSRCECCCIEPGNYGLYGVLTVPVCDFLISATGVYFFPSSLGLLLPYTASAWLKCLLRDIVCMHTWPLHPRSDSCSSWCWYSCSLRSAAGSPALCPCRHAQRPRLRARSPRRTRRRSGTACSADSLGWCIG